MQIFTNGKRCFDSFMEFHVIHLKYQGVKFDHSLTGPFFWPHGCLPSSGGAVLMDVSTIDCTQLMGFSFTFLCSDRGSGLFGLADGLFSAARDNHLL